MDTNSKIVKAIRLVRKWFEDNPKSTLIDFAILSGIGKSTVADLKSGKMREYTNRILDSVFTAVGADQNINGNNDHSINVSDDLRRHRSVIDDFQNQRRAIEINEILFAIEQLDYDALDRIKLNLDSELKYLERKYSSDERNGTNHAPG